MIYKNSYWRKELRQGYAEVKTGNRRKSAFALFSGLISFALYFVLQTLTESVISDAFPEITQPSYFSTVYLYIHISFLLHAFYFIVYFDPLFFSEIRNNAWYLLVKMGHRPSVMIFSKLLALLLFVFLNFTIGFLFIVFLTLFLKFPFIFAYMPALYLSGLSDLVFLTFLSVLLSLFASDIANARLLIGVCAVFIKCSQFFLNYYAVLSNRVAMQNTANLFDLSRTLYMPLAAAMIILCVAVCVFRARNLAKYYSPPPPDESDLPPDARIGYQNPKTGKIAAAAGTEEKTRRAKILSAAAVVILIVFICAALIFNLLIILINTSTPGNEVVIRGETPFIFQSDTMQPAIMKNDLAFFHKTDAGYQPQTGQIILFEQDNVLYIERIAQQSGGVLTVDIDYYPPMSQTGAMRKTLLAQDVHGVYSGRSRWLGALMLFANTIVGRIVFLIVPAVLLFYRHQIESKIRKKRSVP